MHFPKIFISHLYSPYFYRLTKKNSFCIAKVMFGFFLIIAIYLHARACG